ncbi:MAG: peptidylprolyl isomerase [Desulfobacterales bacterium]
MAAQEIVAVFETDKGTIRIRLFDRETPVTAANFVNLSRRNFYRNLNFHRVISDFMIQGGCPHGTGTGDPGYRFEDEFVSALRHNKAGILSMANAGPGTNGSQFFITHLATPHLDNHHTVFGEVLGDEDQAIVDQIAQGDKIKNITIKGDVTDLFEKTAHRIEEWNRILDRKFPDLTPAS